MATYPSTPGPWYCISGAVFADQDEKRPIARMVRDGSASAAGIFPVERDANARLIAAAPELLAALKMLLAAAKCHYEPAVALLEYGEMAEKAIATAEGR